MAPSFPDAVALGNGIVSAEKIILGHVWAGKEGAKRRKEKEEVDKIIAEVFKETTVTSMKDMGRIVAEIKERTHGRADMGVVSQKVKANIMEELNK